MIIFLFVSPKMLFLNKLNPKNQALFLDKTWCLAKIKGTNYMDDANLNFNEMNGEIEINSDAYFLNSVPKI